MRAFVVVRMLKDKRELRPDLKLLEVSCGRGGGLVFDFSGCAQRSRDTFDHA